MLRKLLTASALALATAAPANAAFTINFPAAPTVLSGNNFSGNLGSLINFVSLGAGLSLDSAATIDFYYLGSESGYNNTFNAGSLSFTETADANNFASPVFIGSLFYAAGAVTDWGFTSNVGPAASLGATGFAFFVANSALSPINGLNSVIIGFDDQENIPGDDDNHDDLVILAQISAVPEASTWAMLIAGFVTVGAALRRRNNGLRLRQAV